MSVDIYKPGKTETPELLTKRRALATLLALEGLVLVAFPPEFYAGLAFFLAAGLLDFVTAQKLARQNKHPSLTGLSYEA